MVQRLTPHKRLGRALVVLLSSFSLMLTACAAENQPTDRDDDGSSRPAETEDSGSTQAEAKPADSETSKSASASSAGEATLTIDGIEYVFDLAFCAIGEEDTLIHGPGVSDAGEAAYLDVDFQYLDESWEGEVRIDLGINEQFDSSDSFYVLTTYRDDGDRTISSIAATEMFAAIGTYWVDGESNAVDGKLEVSCS